MAKHSCWCLVIVCGLAGGAAGAAQVVTEPFLGVRRIYREETVPRILKINVVEIDLDAPGLSFRMTPRGEGAAYPYETIRQTTRQFANAVGAQVAINGSFYSTNGSWANNLGITVSNGDAYSTWETLGTANFDDALNITEDNQAAIVRMDPPLVTGFETDPVVPLYNSVTGSHRIVSAGLNVAPPPGGDNLTLIHPRTAVGVTADNKLLLMTVDGRRPGFSEGVNLQELANFMISHGATDAINLDGGGSTTMVMNFYGDGLTAQVLNSPSDGSERSVGTNLAVFALPNGDFNQDGSIDAADYVVWRSEIGGQLAFDAWRANFGTTTASGLGGGALVPEPSACGLVLLVISFVLSVHDRAARIALAPSHGMALIGGCGLSN